MPDDHRQTAADPWNRCSALVLRYGPWPKGEWQGQCYRKATGSRDGAAVCGIHQYSKSFLVTPAAERA